MGRKGVGVLQLQGGGVQEAQGLWARSPPVGGEMLPRIPRSSQDQKKPLET